MFRPVPALVVFATAAMATAPALLAGDLKSDANFLKTEKGRLNQQFDTYAKMTKEPKGTKCDWVYVAPEFSLEDLRKAYVNLYMYRALSNPNTGGSAEMIQALMEGLAELGVKANPADSTLVPDDARTQQGLAEFEAQHPGELAKAGYKPPTKPAIAPTEPATAPGYNLEIYSIASLKGPNLEDHSLLTALKSTARSATGEFILLKDGKPILAARHTSMATSFGNSDKKCGKALASALKAKP